MIMRINSRVNGSDYLFVVINIANAMTCQSMFRWDKPPPSLGLKTNPSKKPVVYLMLASCLAYSSMATCSSETSVEFLWTRWLYIPEVRTLHSLNRGNIKSSPQLR
jgi:hypothetical protein